jgi:hypothetical protein
MDISKVISPSFSRFLERKTQALTLSAKTSAPSSLKEHERFDTAFTHWRSCGISSLELLAFPWA